MMPKYITVSKPFYVGESSHQTIHLDIDLASLIDYYAYHDAPHSVDIYFSKEELEELIECLSKRLGEFDK